MLPFASSPSYLSPVKLQEGVARLSRGMYFKEASLEMTLSLLAESSARITGIERAAIWALTDDGQELRCLELYEAGKNRHSSGGVVRAQDYPGYFAALSREEAIVADDPYVMPATACFAADYLPQHGITAVLDTPIHIRGELQGVLCLEQVGYHQPWTMYHRMFAQSVANLVTLALVEFEAGEARQRAEVASGRLRAVFEALTIPLVLINEGSGLVLDANGAAERLLGYRRVELVGKHFSRLFPAATADQAMQEIRRCQSEQSFPAQVALQRGDGSSVRLAMTLEPARQADGLALDLITLQPLD